MITDDRIQNGKMETDTKWETARISSLLSGKIDKYEYLTGKKNVTLTAS